MKAANPYCVAVKAAGWYTVQLRADGLRVLLRHFKSERRASEEAMRKSVYGVSYVAADRVEIAGR